MKKILMVGAGIGQVFLSKKIKERADYLITVTLPGPQPVIEIADKVCYNNVFDKEGVLQIAKAEKIDAVVSDQNDTMMPTVAYVAEHLSLPGLRTSQVEAYCNKNIFRNNCDRLGIPVPRHVAVSEITIPDEFKDMPFPWIVKPADAQSSLGVEKVNDEDEYYGAIETAIGYSKSRSAILEEYFDGQELVAEGFIFNGKYYNLGFADRKYFRSDKLFIPSQTIFPSIIDQEILDNIVRCEEKMAACIEPQFAIVHSEYLFNAENKEFKVVESALRGGGVYISSHLVPLYSGIDINNILIDCACGYDVDIEILLRQRVNKAAAYVCFYLPEGRITKIEGLEYVKDMECVKLICMDNIRVGETTKPLIHKGQRLGPIIVAGNNRADIENNIRSIQRTLDIRVVDKNGEEHGINWN